MSQQNLTTLVCFACATKGGAEFHEAQVLVKATAWLLPLGAKFLKKVKAVLSAALKPTTSGAQLEKQLSWWRRGARS